jgi:hypothetical protein
MLQAGQSRVHQLGFSGLLFNYLKNIDIDCIRGVAGLIMRHLVTKYTGWISTCLGNSFIFQ